jgi:hypothetical protein
MIVRTEEVLCFELLTALIPFKQRPSKLESDKTQLQAHVDFFFLSECFWVSI